MDGKYREAFQRSTEPTCKSKMKYCCHIQTNSNSVSWLSLTVFNRQPIPIPFILLNRAFLSESVCLTLIFMFFYVWDPGT